MIGVMERIDPRLISAAQSMGAHPVQGFFRVFLPLSMPGVTAASLLVFITSLGFFITPALLGSERETMMAQPIIQQVIDLANWPFAAVLCCVLFLATVVVFAIFNYTVGLSSLVGEPRQQGAKETGLASKFLRDAVGLIGDVIAAPLKRIRARRGYGLGAGRSTKVFAFIVLFTLNVPVLFLVPVSVADGSFVVWPSTGFSIRWYGEYFTDPMWLDATFRSFRVALLTAAGCFVLGVPTALAAMRMSGKTAGALFVLVISPMILPKMIIAVGLFYLYAKIGLVGTDAGLVLGHIVVALPFFFISTLAVLRTYDKRLDHAAASLGASPWKTLRYVTLPLIMTGLISASLFAFIISLDELNIALFTSGGLASTLPKMMWENATLGFTPLLAAVSTTFLLFLTILVLVSIWLTSRRSA
jgi:putative spermidine/putrescine transport system permease protein